MSISAKTCGAGWGYSGNSDPEGIANGYEYLKDDFLRAGFDKLSLTTSRMNIDQLVAVSPYLAYPP